MVYVWLGVVAVSLVIEFVSFELVSIWIALGGIVAMILSACSVALEIQIIVFVVVTIACLFGLRKFALKLLNKTKEKTNIDMVIGTKVKLLKAVTEDEMGLASINGVKWSIKSQNGESIPEGAYVEVVKVEGNKFIVIPTKTKIQTNKEETNIEEQSKVENVENQNSSDKNLNKKKNNK